MDFKVSLIILKVRTGLWMRYFCDLLGPDDVLNILSQSAFLKLKVVDKTHICVSPFTLLVFLACFYVAFYRS